MTTIEIVLSKGTETDIDELERLYNALNDYLAAGVNYPGWIKGVYPTRQTATDAVNEGTLYVARHGEGIAGSVILRNTPEPAYRTVRWQTGAADCDALVIYTLAVHPDFLALGVGSALLDFAQRQGAAQNAKAIRLDVYEGNLPAIALYEKHGFCYINTVDLGLGSYGLDRFRLYEKLL